MRAQAAYNLIEGVLRGSSAARRGRAELLTRAATTAYAATRNRKPVKTRVSQLGPIAASIVVRMIDPFAIEGTAP